MTFDALNSLLEANRPLLSNTWMRNAFRYYGVAELRGSGSNPQIVQFIATTTGRTFRSADPRSSIPEVSAATRLMPVCYIGAQYRGIDDSNDTRWAWCSAFVNHVMITSGYGGTYSLGARSWQHWGQRIRRDNVQFGAIAVFKRTTATDPQGRSHGHVGFYVGEDTTHYLIYGGNQGKRVGVSRYPKNRLVGFRWPAVSS